MAKIRSFIVLPALPEPLKPLETIARNMLWVWMPEFVDLFKRIDNNMWEAAGHNPVKLLASMSQERFEELSENKGFLSQLQWATDRLHEYLDRPTWYDKVCSESTKPLVAYFCAEFGIHECLPIYSGGLGGLAGDHLKSASDLGVPIVGVGLMYQKGYFRQYLNIDGWQQELYIESDFHTMPMELVQGQDGRPLTISIDYPNEPVVAQVWSVSLGRVKLYLLDTNVPVNSPTARMITSSLYGGDREMRIRQEILLGIGGLRALAAMGITPTACHMNEGHAAFMALERIRLYRDSYDMTFEEALEATKLGNIFTIHTPVKAGLDEFPVELMKKYFDSYLPELGVDQKRFLALGRFNPDDDAESFKMPVLALRLSSYRNGVSKLHGQISRRMWSPLWRDIPVSEIPITSITNGIHIKSWLSDEMNSLYERYFGPNWIEEIIGKSRWKNIEQIPDEEIWRTHQRCKAQLIAFARNRLKLQMQRRGTYHTELNWAEEVLDPEALTIGFARRFATYKRGNLLLKSPQRLVKLLSDPQKPIQVVFAGKAHPKDNEGKEIIRNIIHFATKYNVRRRIVFLEDYDISIARVLVHGVDVWLNTPRRPMEASGTSGMKAAINGALNMSTLDGWWCEGYKPELGWVIGSGESYDDAAYQDAVESQALYNLLENEVIPLFYTRSADNMPRAWIARMKKCIQSIMPRFNTHRMVIDYTRRFYNPAAAKWNRLSADAMRRVKALANWKSYIQKAWPDLAIKNVQIRVTNGDGSRALNQELPRLKVGSELVVRALVKLAGLSINDVSVELYHGPVNAWGDIETGLSVTMTYENPGEQNGEHWFAGRMPCRKTGQYGVAVRVLPKNEDLINPYELGLILWELPAQKGALVNY